MLDTLTYAHKLREAGFTEKQAEIQAQALAELVEDRLVTKQYLDLRLAELRTDVIKWATGSVFAAVGLFAALVKLMS